MKIKFRCKKCKGKTSVSYETLKNIWRRGYEEMPEDKREASYLTAEIRCLCGYTNKFDGQMFRHCFDVIFTDSLPLED